ncbi:hypothetical protein [Gracilibacillus phocaeensis]|uniref:hypothetical protein n=1 Tax=Gracilibacillus phocaeensis TaxID=2042304 RepID=UPI00102F80AE|nr:hypothetical protein [Gracilibacillus phocaeensis]
MFIVLCLILLLLLGLLLKESAMFPIVIKALVVLYYMVVTPIFITGYHRIHEKYNMNDGPVIPEGWDVSSDWTFSFSFAFIIPIWLLVIFVLFRKMKPTRGKNSWLDFIVACLFSGAILFIPFVIFNLAYGMSP